MSVTAAPLPNRGAVAVLFDITDFERVEKTRRDFIANVSHELRTPLTSVQGYSETLLDGNPSPETSREFLEVIRKNATRMVRLTEDLLTLAKVESGETKPKIQTISAADLLSDAERYWNETRRDPDVQFDVKSNSTQTVLADRDAILQVFSNLIENACKYASSGGRIEIGSNDVEGHVSFYVRDFGPGIPPEHLPRLFERFYRVDRVRSRETGGTGLGLAICKHIIRVHRGIIRAESELGKGSTFVFTLPIA